MGLEVVTSIGFSFKNEVRVSKHRRRSGRSHGLTVVATTLAALVGCNDANDPSAAASRADASRSVEAMKPAASGPAFAASTERADASATSAATDVADEGRVVAPPAEPNSSAVVNGPAAARFVPSDVPRVYAKTRNVWIRGTPTYDTQWIGFLWWGDSVPLKSTEPVAGPGCATWYAVEPRGYVCVDGKRATLDPRDPVLLGTFPYSHNPDSANPHPHYGETTGAHRYLRLPTEKSQRAREWDYRFRMEWIAKAEATGERAEQLLGVDLSPVEQTSLDLPDLPSTLQMAHRELIPRSTVAWTKEVRHEGRNFVLTDDLAWVAKDRIKPYDEVEYQGLRLQGALELPLALFRRRDATAYALQENSDGEAHFVATDKRYPRLGWVSLTGEKRSVDKRTYHQTGELDWVEEGEAVVPKVRDKTPWGAPVYGEDSVEQAPKGRRTWVEVSILGGWLLAYEGTTPVFVTLMSPGRGGPPHGKTPPLETSSTPTGFFKVTGKFVTSTMIAPNDLVHSAVPWAQNFSGPYAIHGAYWHNEWGEPKSGGCVNLSPKDARWMFEFTEPAVPKGWHGVRWLPGKEGSTSLVITE